MQKNDDLEKSRTQLKKEAVALQKMGEKLVSLSDDQLRRIDLPAELLEAVAAAKAFKSHGARRRQLQYIGSLMRNVDVQPIQRALTAIEQGAYGQAKAFQRIEGWRDELVAGNDALINEILDRFPEVDRQRLGQLVRSARKEKQKGSPPKSARNLFRYLKDLSADR